jgi:hypothetical protein
MKTAMDFSMSVYIMPFTAKAALYYHVLKNKGAHAAGFFDNKAEIGGMAYDSCEISSPRFPGEGGVAVLCEKKYYEANEEQLRGIGFLRIERLDDILTTEDAKTALPLLDRDAFLAIAPLQAAALKNLPRSLAEYALPQRLRGTKTPLVVDVVEILLTERCSLRCKACANLMQYYDRPQDMDPKQLCRDIDLIAEKTDYIRNLRVFGGEPLLYGHLPEILAHAQQHKGCYGFLSTTTNGTVLPSESMIQAMKEADLFVNVSDYGELSRNIGRLADLFDRHGVGYSINKVRWQECQQLVSDTPLDAQAVFDGCNAICMTLRDGFLYRCPFLAHGKTLGMFPPDARNHIEIKDAGIGREEIRRFKDSKTAPPGCAYCSGNSGIAAPLPVAEQADRPLPYRRHC